MGIAVLTPLMIKRSQPSSNIDFGSAFDIAREVRIIPWKASFAVLARALKGSRSADNAPEAA
jgi:hypothetical protein